MRNFIISVCIVVLCFIFTTATKAETHYQVTPYDNVQLVTKTSTSFWGNTSVSYGLRVKGIEVCEIRYTKIIHVPELKLLLFNEIDHKYGDELKVFSTETGECLYYFNSVAGILDITKDKNQMKIRFGRSVNIYYEETFIRKDGRTQLVPKKRDYFTVIPEDKH